MNVSINAHYSYRCNIIVGTANVLIQINEGVYPNIERDCTCVDCKLAIIG